jgi:hypothetical protein
MKIPSQVREAEEILSEVSYPVMKDESSPLQLICNPFHPNLPV